MTLDDLDDLIRLAEESHIRQVAAHLFRGRIDEAEEIDPVFRMLHELAPDQLPDVARADDDGVLNVGAMTARECPSR